MGPGEAARRALAGIPPSAQILLHIDVDVFQKAELPAAYFPHAQGLTLVEGSQLIAALSADARVRLIEVSEYASLRDLDQRWVNKLIDILAHALSGSAR
jgi:arginase family enzyme